MANNGVITRKDIIQEDALNWGPEYAKQIQNAIAANKDFANGLKEINALSAAFKTAKGQQEYIALKQQQLLLSQRLLEANRNLEVSERAIQERSRATSAVWNEQNQAENALISTRRRNQLATESTNRELIRQRLLLAETNAETRRQTIANGALESAYRQLSAQVGIAGDRVRNIIATGRLASESQRQYNSRLQEAQREFTQLNTRVRLADGAIGTFNRNVGNYPQQAISGIRNLVGAFGIIGGISLFANIATDIFNTTKELQSLNTALKQVSGSEEELAGNQEFLRQISEAYGVEIKGLTKQFTQFYVSAKDKLAGNEIKSIFESITKAGASMGLSTESQERAFLALNQMMSKGTIQAEELRGQLGEALPGSLGIMAKALGVTEVELGKLMKDGKLLSSEVLPKFAKELEKVYGIENLNRVNTLTAAQTRLSNSWTEFIGSLDGGSGKMSRFFTIVLEGVDKVIGGLKLLNQTSDERRTDVLSILESNARKLASKEIADYSKKELEDVKAYDLQKAKIQSEEYKRLVGRNLILKALRKETPFGLVESKENEIERKANLKRLDELNNLTVRIRGRVAAYNEVLEGMGKPKNKPVTVLDPKSEKDRLKRLKALNDAEYELLKQRAERYIKVNQEIADDQELNDDVRVMALENVQQKDIYLTDLTKKHKLDADKFVLQEDKLNANQKLIILEDAFNKNIDIQEKTVDQIKKIRLFDEESYKKDLARQLSENQILQNEELQRENERFALLGDIESLNNKKREESIEEHERKIFEIKKKYSIDAIKLQILNLESELSASDKLPIAEQLSAEKRLEISEKLSKAKLDLSEVELSKKKEDTKVEIETEIEKVEKLLEIQLSLTSAIADLVSQLNENKIQAIQYEIDKNNEKYDREIELAKDDEKQKELLEQERKKKNSILEEKKKKEQKKQAVANKAAALVEASISTALSILAALRTTPFLPLGPTMATLAGVLGGIQIATIAATPIPKYKMGRIGGKKETAIVGDGGVSEVIERKGGQIELTPAKDTLVQLMQGDNVYKDIDSYKKSRRNSVLASLGLEQKKMNEFNSITTIDNSYGSEIVRELQLTRKAMNKKPFVIKNQKQIDLNHELWKYKNIKS